jgi:hypothetical protein
MEKEQLTLSTEDAVKIAVADARVTMLMWVIGLGFPITWALMLTGFGLVITQLFNIAARLPT